jgi:cytochrome P450
MAAQRVVELQLTESTGSRPLAGRAVVRTASVDLQVQSISIAAGTKVVLVIGAANRDERVFADLDRFNLHRSQSSVMRHIAFGHGIHHCLGAVLARCEAVHTFAAVLDRFPHYRLTSDLVEVVHSAAIRGPASLRCTPE